MLTKDIDRCDAMRFNAKRWEIKTKVRFESLQFNKMSQRSSHLFVATLNPPILRIENISMNLWFTIYLWLEKCRACFTFQTKWLIRKFARSLMQCDIYFFFLENSRLWIIHSFANINTRNFHALLISLSLNHKHIKSFILIRSLAFICFVFFIIFPSSLQIMSKFSIVDYCN